MKSFGKLFLWVGLFVFFIAGYALGNTHYVTQTGGGGAMSAVEFNALTGDHSGNTFFFSGDFSTRIKVQIHGSPSGHVALSGLQSGTCNPTATGVNTSLCAGAANLQYGMDLGTDYNPISYVIVQDFNMDGEIAPGSSATNHLLQL